MLKGLLNKLARVAENPETEKKIASRIGTVAERSGLGKDVSATIANAVTPLLVHEAAKRLGAEPPPRQSTPRASAPSIV